MKRSLPTSSEESAWPPWLVGLCEALKPQVLLLYLQTQPEVLELTFSHGEFSPTPLLSIRDGFVAEILQSRNPMIGERLMFGDLFASLPARHLIAASFHARESRRAGIVVLGTRKRPAEREMGLLKDRLILFSLLLSVEALRNQREELGQKLSLLEKKLSAAYRQLRESDQLTSLGHFAGGLAHELNTPLAAIRTYTEYLQLFVKDGAEQDSVEGILKAVSHCRDIVESVLRFSRQGKTQREPVPLRYVVHDALILTEPDMEKKKVKVEARVDGNPTVMGNHTRLVQLLTNLLTNARDSVARPRLVPREGRIELDVVEENGSAFMSVADNGAGIAAGILGQIFNPFFTTKEVGEGLGLGLSICHAIAQEHGGSLEVVTQEGEGAKFLVRLPILAETP